uniref:Wsv415-like protein n=1 Tax=Pasiphaea japonica whispovirus TaxID=2984286 RepID=A0A9C7EZC0_9VIRU|nr:MAG: wsv415-like protein [Pasiphaea japonica whispovirus]
MASSESAAAIKDNGVEFIREESPAHKLSGAKYIVVGPDPCEDPETVYVDIVVRIQADARELSKEWGILVKKLKAIEPWSVQISSSSPPGYYEKQRKNTIKELSFITREDPVGVHLRCLQGCRNEFARRMTLKELCDIILSSGCVVSKKHLFNLLFDIPWEIKGAVNVTGIANRSRFTVESMIEWFFNFDTYSKCILFLEIINRHLQCQASPLSILLDDVYCSVFSKIIRQSYITKVNSDANAPESTLSATSDIKLLRIDECVKNFITTNLDITQLMFTNSRMSSALYGDQQNQLLTKNESTTTNIESVKKILKRKNADSSCVYRSQFTKTPQKNSGITTYSTIKGYNNGKLSPIHVYIRNQPIVPNAHNHLLFPVFSAESPGADILFYLNLKPVTAAYLLLPGIFRHPHQFLTGDCKWLGNKDKPVSSTKYYPMWKYTLADYCPLRSYMEEMLPPTKTLEDGTTNIRNKLLNARSSYF